MRTRIISNADQDFDKYPSFMKFYYFQKSVITLFLEGDFGAKAVNEAQLAVGVPVFTSSIVTTPHPVRPNALWRLLLTGSSGELKAKPREALSQYFC